MDKDLDSFSTPVSAEMNEADWMIRDLIRRLGLNNETELHRLALQLLTELALKLDRMNAYRSSPSRIGLPERLMKRLK